MWKGPGQDPGGEPETGPPPGSSQELSDLKDQFEQQQVLIAQLKEMIRKNEQSNVTQEKVDEYMNTLSKRGGKAKKQKKDDDTNKKTVDIPASQKISLLRQQVEENKAKLAERGKSKKGIEDMVTQLKAQLDDSQQLISLTPHNLSLQDTKEYNENSSSQELYTVLLTKEKRISDLLAKVQKLESNVLDLQENVKEKDSVIDARTKAITLMTENLSRKGKTTLDALDDTKEQMRKMQENFVKLEADMKARQVKLLDDLRHKNYEIAELQEINDGLNKQLKEEKEFEEKEDFSEELETLKAQNSQLSQFIQQKESRIKELEEQVNQTKEKDTEGIENEEVNKLKKQLEESNKNMIKVKAQHKSKVKELNKKIEAFKKVSDSNAEIVRLETETGKLNQKIAELEEEKGSLQLKLVESDSAKGSEPAERKNELEEKLEDQENQLEEKDKVISFLEAEISRSKSEIESLSEKLSSLFHLENAQVTSEMASIQFEEQMEALENEKRQLTTENENLVKEKDQLLETIEQLKKEKQEFSTKLDHYIQENMELIDKLEKLSVEKVSSAESIEIVEGLTQQEKLELEAYQKNLDLVAGNLKSSEENLPQGDLNESVNELTEETSELLQRIELFTVERREVMEKMEQLKQENLNLSLKVKEVENNRDILAETYEQLQSEKEVLDAKVETVEAENSSLKEKLNQNESESREERTENRSEMIKELEDELVTSKKLLEEKRTELEEVNDLLRRVQSELEERNKENCHLNNSIIDLNRTLADLENDNKSLQIKITQLEELGASLNQQIEKGQEEIEAVSNSEWETRRLLESKDNEITKLMKERDNTESVILDLQKTIRDKDESFHKITSEIKEKYLTLQRQLEDNSGNLQNITAPLQTKVEELTVKNKDQLEKMKKIAANLKKKTQAYQELEEKLKETQDRHEVELKTSLQQLQDLESEVSRLQKQFDDKCEEFQVLEVKNVDLQNVITDLRVKLDKNNEMSLQQELLLTKENLGSVESSLQAKIQELEMIIETQEGELSKTKERCAKLEEGISFVEERRLSLERRAIELGAELEEKSVTCEEMSRSEDLLERRLAALAAHDEAIEKKLEDAITENQELNKQNQKLGEKNEKMRKKLEEFKTKLQGLEGQQGIVEELETQSDNMKKHIHNLENDLKTLQNEYEKLLEESKNDFDKVNGDWQAQFEEVLNEKNELMVKCEKFEEELKEIVEKEFGFNNELVDYKMKLESSEIEIQNYEEQIQRLSKEKEEVDSLRHEIAIKEETIRNYEERFEMLTRQSEEFLKLKEMISEKESIIKDFEQQIHRLSREKQEAETQLQEQSFQKQTASTSLSSFFDNVPREEPKLVDQLQEELSMSKSRIAELENTIQDLSQKQSSQVVSSSQEPQQSIPTFVWSSQSNDPFDFVATAPEAPPPPPLGNTQQELLEKIKTLQFMLFNADKKKEETLIQCQELTNELTRLIYEKQMQPQEVESQIVQDVVDTPDSRSDLRGLEFTETKPPVMSSLEAGPVVEEVIKPEQAYLCYADNEASQIESQVLSDADLVDTPAAHHQLQQLEFEQTRPPVVSTDRPVTEEPCAAREAYLCYNTFGENDDGWGWGPEEAKLEEEHAKKSENLESLANRVRVLEMERENHLEEIRQLQVKSGKLIKKLKEFKAKNEELSQRKKSEGDLFNLDDTIQEELKLQIQQVEKKLKETSSELEKERHEKASLTKKIDVLTSANERMIEMKEKQDVELLGWQQNCRDLNSKLERFEWGDDGFASADQPSPKKHPESGGDLDVMNKKIEELNEMVKDLTLDNEELQALLEEQRSLRLVAEKSIIHGDSSTEEKQQLQRDRDALSSQLQVTGEEKKLLQDQVNELIKKNSELSDQFQLLEQQNAELEALQTSKDEIITHLNNKIRQVETEMQSLLAQLQEKSLQVDSLHSDAQTALDREREVLIQQLQDKTVEIESLRNSYTGEKDHLLRELQEKSSQIDSLKASMDSQTSTETEKQVLFKELQEKNAQIESLRESVDFQIESLRQELDNQIKVAEALLEEKKTFAETIAGKDTEIATLSATMEQMTQEWEMRINQRGADVAESWKLHLERRESEFSQIEQLLRKEINELEEKSNALVNENNELRKNVDAEIRNEVDRVAALQQQINDRQQYINDLTRTLQEKQSEVEGLQVELDTIKKNHEEAISAVFEVVQSYSKETVEHNAGGLVKAFDAKEMVIRDLHLEIDEVKAKLVELQGDVSRKVHEIENLNQLLSERNQTITSLTSQVEQVQHLKDYEHENIQNMQQNLLEYQQANANISTQLQTLSAQLDAKEREIANLRKMFEDKEREHGYALEQLSQEYRASINEQSQEIEKLSRRLSENENHYEELLQNKETELEGVRFDMRNQSETFNAQSQELEDLVLQLQTKIEESANLQQKIDEQTVLIEEENRQLTDLRAIIEEQVLKIEELKTELYQKSNDYDSLIAEMDISRTSAKETETETAARPRVQESEDLTEPVSRAELDLALYMLHQRDVRCEELTVELTQLLEERDTLQLRLSNVLREKEEIGRKMQGEKAVPSGSGTVPKVQTEMAQDVLDPLTTKLSELRSVGYKKDKSLVDEQEMRRLQQLSIMQQHRDVAAKLPPEAAARLVDASYTLSRDVQSPSKVLLNWLWGRSTPKVNNI